MKIRIHDTDEAQRAMEDACITKSAISLRGQELEAKAITGDGWADTDTFIFPPAAFTIIPETQEPK